MGHLRRSFVTVACALCAGAALAQQPDPAADAEALDRLCAALPASPEQAADQARRAECILSGRLPSADRIGEARSLARTALQGGEPAGGLVLYLAFMADPANQATREGAVDREAYQRLAARGLEERRTQAEAIEGLAQAAQRGHPTAGMLLAQYFHDTVAPGNVARMGAMVDVLMRQDAKHPVIERYLREANAIARVARATKASPRAFLQTYQQGAAAAREGYRVQSGGKSCEQVQLKSVSAGEIMGAQFLPLQGPLVTGSYLVQGQWAEFWTYQACDEEVPVKVAFRADGWGGSTSTATHNKGD